MSRIELRRSSGCSRKLALALYRCLATTSFLGGTCSAAFAAVTISSDATQNMACSAGVCSPTATDAVLNVSDLENLLASGNVTVTTTGAGVQASDIDVVAAFSWSSTSTLLLDAYQSLTVSSSISVTGEAGLSLTTNDGGKDGLLSFENGGNATFQNLSSQLAINGNSFTLVGSIASLASAIAGVPDGSFALAANYDASKDGTYTGSPVETEFKGSFEGLGNTISNLSIANSADTNIALFARSVQAQFAHLALTNVSITSDLSSSSSQEMGALAGEADDSNFDEVAVDGTISASKKTVMGGLIGYSSGNHISRCSSAARVSGGGTRKGLIAAGGLIGFSYMDDAITLSFATGDVSANFGEAGGLAGAAYGSITQSFATGTISGGSASEVGGLSGLNDGAISNSYAAGSVSTSLYDVGGFVGENEGTITSSYSISAVTGNTSYIGGLIGYDSSSGGSLSRTYWDTMTSGIANLSQGAGNIPNDPGITGKTTKALQKRLPKGFSTKIWGENSNINSGLPYLLNNPPPE